ncbi:MAG: hypothetical protein R2813_05545 [Flavobacteriales bacterium]
MKADISEIKETLIGILNEQIPPLRMRDGGVMGQVFEGTKPVMQGKQKVDGHYFASIVEKPKDIRFYFFPVYTHVAEFKLSDELSKALKGKSCFHVKKLTPEMESEIRTMAQRAVDLYLKEGLI